MFRIVKILSILIFVLTMSRLFAQEIHLVGTCDTPGWAKDVSVQNGIAYVADGEYGLRVINVSNPEDPYEIAYLYTGQNAPGVVAIGEYAYVMDDGVLCIIDISEPDSPEEIGSYDTEKGVNAGYDLSVTDDKVYLADRRDGLRVIDVSDKEHPTLIDTSDTSEETLDVAVVENIVYLAVRWDGLYLIDISDINNMSVLGTYDTPGKAYGVSVVGDYAYIADDFGGLRIIDISNPSSPYEVGYYDTPGMTAYDVIVKDNIAYVSETSILRVIDVSDPENPKELDGADGGGKRMDIDGNYLYLAARSPGLKIYDISEFMSIHSKQYTYLPEESNLYPAYPNPFNSTTTIRYGLPYPSNVSLQIYKTSGQQITTLFEGYRQAGIHSVTLKATDLPSGLYFVRLNASDQVFTQKVMLIR